MTPTKRREPSCASRASAHVPVFLAGQDELRVMRADYDWWGKP